MARIMVIDDDAALLEIVKSILEGVGHEVTCATSGKKALEMLKSEKPDLILLDVMIPKLDGWQILELIRKQDDFKNIPVSMLTINALTPEVIRRKEMGELVDYIAKPFGKEELIKKVNSILEDIGRIAQEKAKLRSLVRDMSISDAYEITARSERLHKSLTDTLTAALEKKGAARRAEKNKSEEEPD